MSRCFDFMLVVAVLVAVVADSAICSPAVKRKPTTPYTRYVASQLANVRNSKRAQELSNSTSLDKNFSGVTLFK